MSEFEKQCIILFVNHPIDWRNYLGCFNNPRYADRLISNLITHDKGIEFEIGYDLVSELRKVYKKSTFKSMTFDKKGDEVQLRIRKGNIRPLYDLYKFLSRKFLEDYRQIRSGIHIHSDLESKLNEQKVDYLYDVLNPFVDRMAKDYFKYSGTYNRNEFSTSKGFSLVYRRSFHTLEYRCIKMTWSLKELLLHLIFVDRITEKIRKSERPDVDSLNKILRDMIEIKNSVVPEEFDEIGSKEIESENTLNRNSIEIDSEEEDNRERESLQLTRERDYLDFLIGEMRGRYRNRFRHN